MFFQKNIFIVIILFILILIIGLFKICNDTQLSNNPTGTTSTIFTKEKSKIYTNTINNYSFTVPSSWNISYDNKEDIIFVDPPGSILSALDFNENESIDTTLDYITIYTNEIENIESMLSKITLADEKIKKLTIQKHQAYSFNEAGETEQHTYIINLKDTKYLIISAIKQQKNLDKLLEYLSLP